MTNSRRALADAFSQYSPMITTACTDFCKRWRSAEYGDAYGNCALSLAARMSRGEAPTPAMVAHATQNALRAYQRELKRWSRERASGSMDKWGGH